MIANFTPVSAAIGGVLIGLAATLLMLFNGRVAGISGILAACLNLRGSEKSWSAAFIAGLILAPLTASLAGFPCRRHGCRIAGPWSWWPASWWDLEPVSAAAAHPGTACAGWRGCQHGRSLPPLFSWRPRSSWSLSRVM